MGNNLLQILSDSGNSFLFSLIAIAAIFKIVVDCLPTLIKVINSKSAKKLARKIIKIFKIMATWIESQLHIPGREKKPKGSWLLVMIFALFSALTFVTFSAMTIVGMQFLSEMHFKGQLMFAGHLITLIVLARYFYAEAHRIRLYLLK